MENLIQKLEPACAEIYQRAKELAASKTHFFIEIEHFFFKALTYMPAGFHQIVKHYDIDISTVLKQFNAAIDRLPTGNGNTVVNSPFLWMTLERAWLISSLHMGENTITAGSILLAVTDYDPLRGLILENCPLLLRIPRSALRDDLKNGFTPQKLEIVL